MKYSDSPKRKPGAVRDAIIEALAYRVHGATVADITREVSQRIGPTPSSSIRSYLRLNTPKLFVKIDRGHYRVREEAQATLRLIEQENGSGGSSIAASLFLTKRAVEKHINAIFLKLNLRESADTSRRVMAALIYLAGESSTPRPPAA